MKSLQRQLPFLHSVLKQPNRFKRQELLQHANADQVNAVSELVLNLLKKQPPIMAKLHPYKKVLRNLGRRQHSMKKTSSVAHLAKKGEDCGKVFTSDVNVFDNDIAKACNVGESFARCQSRMRRVERGMLLLEA